MRFDSQAIEHQHFQTAQAFDRGRRYLAQIRCVSKIVEAVSDHRQPAVNYFQGRNLKIMPEAKRGPIDHRMWDDLRQAPAEVRRLKNVFEDAPDVDPCSLVGVESQRAMAKVQRPNVVETKDMICMAVCHQYCVEMLQMLPQRLLAKISRGVNDDGLAGMFDQD